MQRDIHTLRDIADRLAKDFGLEFTLAGLADPHDKDEMLTQWGNYRTIAQSSRVSSSAGSYKLTAQQEDASKPCVALRYVEWNPADIELPSTRYLMIQIEGRRAISVYTGWENFVDALYTQDLNLIGEVEDFRKVDPWGMAGDRQISEHESCMRFDSQNPKALGGLYHLITRILR